MSVLSTPPQLAIVDEIKLSAAVQAEEGIREIAKSLSFWDGFLTDETAFEYFDDMNMAAGHANNEMGFASTGSILQAAF